MILETLQSIPCINFTANELASGGELKSQDFFIEVVVNNAVASLEQTQDDKYVFFGTNLLDIFKALSLSLLMCLAVWLK